MRLLARDTMEEAIMNQRRTAPSNEAGMSADRGDVEAIGAPGCPSWCPLLLKNLLHTVSCLHLMQCVTGHHFMLLVQSYLAPLFLVSAYHPGTQLGVPCLAGPITADHELLTGRTLPLLLAAHPKL